MSEQPFERWEAQLRATARTFPYPPTPDVASAVGRRLAAEPPRPIPHRRLAWAAAVVVLLLAALLAVPQVRAAVLEVLRIGAIRILLTEPTPTVALPSPTPTETRPTATATSTPSPPVLDLGQETTPRAATTAPTETPLPTVTPSPTSTETPPTATPRPSPTPLSSVLDLAGETTLAEARAQAGFSIRLPAYPVDLGAPDRVFLQDLGGPVVVLVWLDSDQPDRVRLSLHQLGPGTFGQKLQPSVVRETAVHGQPALWTTGPYMLQFLRGGQVIYDDRRLVRGNVLIWVEKEITYRLESDLSLEEAVRIAESLQ